MLVAFLASPLNSVAPNEKKTSGTQCERVENTTCNSIFGELRSVWKCGHTLRIISFRLIDNIGKEVVTEKRDEGCSEVMNPGIGPLHDLVIWYKIT